MHYSESEGSVIQKIKQVNPRGKGILGSYTYSYSGTQPYPSRVNLLYILLCITFLSSDSLNFNKSGKG